VTETRAAAAAAESSEQQMREEGEELRKRWDHKWQISCVRHSYFKHPGPLPLPSPSSLLALTAHSLLLSWHVTIYHSLFF